MSDKRTFKIEKAQKYWKKRTLKVVESGKRFKILRPVEDSNNESKK